MVNTVDAGKRAAHKRAHGEGSIYRRASDGKWVGSLTAGVQENGKPARRVVYGDTQREVQSKLGEMRQRLEQGTLQSAKADRLTVAAYLQRWLEATKGTVRPATYENYAYLVRLHIPPVFGKMRLVDVRPDHIQRVYAQELASGFSANSVHHIHSVIHRAFHQAVRWGYLPRNVAEAVDPPRVPKHELHPPTTDELERLLDTTDAAEDPLAALWTVAVYSGCRAGELLGLRWSDLDLEAGTLTVRRTLLGASNCVPRFGEPKTSQSRRTITLPPDAMRSLRQHRTRQVEQRLKAPHYASHDLVFATHLGTPLLARNVTRAFKAALARAELLATVRFHDLRHAAATTMLSAGVHLKVASERLGHSNVGITGDLYMHAVPGLEADAAAKMQGAIRRKRLP